MPWKEMSAMDQREEFVALALKEGANRRELWRRFAISAPTAYKWLARHEAGAVCGARFCRAGHISVRDDATAPLKHRC